LARQKYRCALTGRVLTPKSCSLDHILAVSRGGEHSMRNAQVLDKTVNQAKGTLTNDEFVQLCREVVAHADSRASDHQ
jgi:5-methylcytosine-specific restriction endonuclease McrA